MLSTDEPECKQKSPANSSVTLRFTLYFVANSLPKGPIKHLIQDSAGITAFVKTCFLLRQLKIFITCMYLVFLRNSISSSQSSHYARCTLHSQIFHWGSGSFPELNEWLWAICWCWPHRGMSSICSEMPVLSSSCSYDKIILPSPNRHCTWQLAISS